MAIDITKWQGRISRAESYLNQRRAERLQSIRLYTGTFFSSPLNNNDEITEVNFLYEYVDVLIASIYARNPYCFVRPLSTRWVAFAETMETVLNYYVKELKIKKKVQGAILDAVLQPPGWINLGYLFINEKTKLKKEIEEEFPELKDLNSKKEKTEPEIGILDETIKVDEVFAEHISSWNVLFPDGYHNIRECPWMAIKQKLPLEDLQNNPIYNDNKYLVNNTPVQNQSQFPQIFNMKRNVVPTYSSQTDLETIPAELFHIFDRRDMKRFTLAKNFYKGTLFERDWDYLPEGFSLFPLIFNEIPATDEKCNAYPLSDVIPMFPQLKELSLISSAMNRHRKRAGTLLLGKKGNIKETDAQRIQSASDVDFVLLDDITEANLRGFTPPALSQDFYSIRNNTLEDLYRISGFKQLLGSSSGIETATESDILRQGSVLRQSKRVDVIEDFMREVMIYLAGLLWQFKTRRQISEIMGEEVTEEMWPTLPEDRVEARKIIQKQLQFTIDVGSSKPPKDEAVERKQYLDAASTIKATFPNRIKDDAFLMQILKKIGIKDLENVVIAHDEQEIAAAQQENQLLLKNIPQIVSPNENHMLHLQVHAQAYQTPGLQPTDAMHQHIDSHAKFMEQNSPKANPQKGDSKIPTASTAPNFNRQGVTEYADILGSVKPREAGVNR